ncbi:AAA family ATPase [Lacrimispora indolis]|uniref:AAA family ATPase n=1 Tax=Lacrimispora indolis TaxID=69825 RepID=UPI00040E8168|nr:AAA family ATPase [[Clostridium] methoxybenzovorans]
MNKIIIFYGSQKAFYKYCPNIYRNLTDIAMEMDQKKKKLVVELKGQEYGLDEEERIHIENFVIGSDEYSGVNDHVIINFANFLSDLIVDNLYIQNPPLQIANQLSRIYKNINIIREKYKTVTQKIIKSISNNYERTVIGQHEVKRNLLKALLPLTIKERNKPVVILFYGDSGIGKTETALFLAKILNEKLFRKQFSMFQNNQFSTYLFGGTHHDKSFAKDLLDRESNVILLDEFDKAHPSFHSAFYQLFDDGVYEDTNYFVEVKKAIIICTSNYQSIDEIKEKLGKPIYNRFDVIIHFDNLNDGAKEKIGDKIYKEVSLEYKRQFNLELRKDHIERLYKNFCSCDNAREIRHLIEDIFALEQLDKMLIEKNSKSK